MSLATKFDSSFYITENEDVEKAIALGHFSDALTHFIQFGSKEFRKPNEIFNPSFYLVHNPDVAPAVSEGFFDTTFHHYQLFGESEDRAPSFEFHGFDAAVYLSKNPDVAWAVSFGIFSSAIDHFIAFGRHENRPGTSFNSSVFTLTTNNDNFTGFFGDDEFIATTETLQEDDVLDGGNGNDTLSIAMESSNLNDLVFPDLTNILALEAISINLKGAVYNSSLTQALNFSIFPSVQIIEFLEGTTIDGATLAVHLNENQSLYLKNLKDGDSDSNSISDGGLRIVQSSEAESLKVFLDGVGPEDVAPSRAVIIDFSNSEIVDLDVVNKNAILLSGSGTDFSKLNLIGSGQTHLGFLPSSMTELNGRLATADINFEVQNNNMKIVTGSGNDIVRLHGGATNVATGAGRDAVNITGGLHQIQTESGDDYISVTAGTLAINSGDGDDTIIAQSGATGIDFLALDGGNGSDQLNIISTGTVTLPTALNFEQYTITDTVHQSLDFSFSSSIVGIELKSGSTIDGATITTTLADGQTLTLEGLVDGDTSSASLGDGGLVIAQSGATTSLDLILDDVGPVTSTPNENVFIDIAGTGVTTANVTSGNNSFVVVSNSGGALSDLQLFGTGSMALGTLPSSITNVNGASASANLTLTIGSSGSNTIVGGIGDDAITLTGGINNVSTGDGNDTITTSTNLAVGDRIDGGDGTDTFEVIHTGLATIPSTANLSNIEQIAIQDTIHQSLDFSGLATIVGIELNSGTTVDGATIVTALGAGQALTLDSIIDGDTAAASLGDGGIQITQPNSVTSIDLTVDDIGPAGASVNQNVFIDIAGTAVVTANVTSANDSFIVLENSGGALSTLNLEGSGNLGIMSALANSVTNINGVSSTANLTLTPGTGGSSTTTGSGNDVISLTGGANTVNTNSGQDNITASGGTNNVNTGNGDDTINLTGGTNTIVTGNNNDTVTASAGNNDIDTNNGDDQVTLTGGTNDVNTGSNNDTVTLSSGTDTVDMGSGNDTVEAGNNLSAADTVNGGSGNSDTIEITAALTDALTARLSNFEVLEIKGGGGITHDISGITGLTSLKASGALTGAIVVTDLAEAAEVDISAAIGNNLTINQINSAGGSDTLAVDFSGGGYTTGGSIIAPNIETVTIKTSSGSTKVMSGGTFANATNVTIVATSGNLTITDLTAINMTALDVSSSNRNVNITTGADVFAGAFTFSSGSRDDTLDLDGATLVAGSVFELGGRQDTLTLNSDAVATVVRTSVTNSNNAFSVRDDATTANTPGFTSGSDTFDYNGSLLHDSATSVVVAAGATLQAAVAADSDATVYVIQDANGDSALESAINDFANSVTRAEANTLETEAVDTGLLSYTGLDSAFDSSDIVLIAIDSETNEDATVANNGGTAVYRFQNTDTSTVDTVLSTELELIGVFQDAALGTGDFV